MFCQLCPNQPKTVQASSNVCTSSSFHNKKLQQNSSVSCQEGWLSHVTTATYHTLVMIASSQDCRHDSLFATALSAVCYHAHGTPCASLRGSVCTADGLCSGRADYFGLAVNRAARFLGAACGGQVLAERGLVEEVVQYWHSLVYK